MSSLIPMIDMLMILVVYLLVHAADPRSLEEAAHIFEQFKRYADVPYLVGVTHTDETQTPAEVLIEAARARLAAPVDPEHQALPELAKAEDRRVRPRVLLQKELRPAQPVAAQ